MLMRQIGVVIGLTVVLTFPVTVVSGAGSQKQTDHVVHFAAGRNGPERTVIPKTETPRSPDNQVGGTRR